MPFIAIIHVSKQLWSAADMPVTSAAGTSVGLLVIVALLEIPMQVGLAVAYPCLGSQLGWRFVYEALKADVS